MKNRSNKARNHLRKSEDRAYPDAAQRETEAEKRREENEAARLRTKPLEPDFSELVPQKMQAFSEFTKIPLVCVILRHGAS